MACESNIIGRARRKMIRRYIEISCDTCNCACHYQIGCGSAEVQARDEGWIITKDGRHYDSVKCYNARQKSKVSQATDA
jgi:hypothetical protein